MIYNISNWFRRKIFPGLLPAIGLTLLTASCYTVTPKNGMANSDLPVPLFKDSLQEATFPDGALPEEFAKYLETWRKLATAAPLSSAMPPWRETVLPPSEAQLAITAEHFAETLPMLLKCMAGKELTLPQKRFFEGLALLHQQQSLLSGVYHACNDLQHTSRGALPAMLLSARRLREFQRRFAAESHNPMAEKVNGELSEWLALWENRNPLEVLPSLWHIEATADAPEGTPSKTALRFSALRVERPFDPKTLPPELAVLPKLVLRQEFDKPAVASGRLAFLIFPSMPPEVEIYLNQHQIHNPHPGHPWAVPLTDDLLSPSKKQQLAVRFPTAEIGCPALPVCLAAGNLP